MILNHLPPFHQNAWEAVFKAVSASGESFNLTELSGQCRHLQVRCCYCTGGQTHGSPPRPNSDSQSSCGFRSCGTSPPPPTLLCVFTCLLELSAQTLTCSLCCRGRWPRWGATVNGDWRGKDLGECALSEGCSPFLCSSPHHTHNSRLWVLCLRLPCCLSWLRIEQPCFSTVRAHRTLPAVHKKLFRLVISFFLYFAGLQMCSRGICVLSQRGILGWHRGEIAVIWSSFLSILFDCGINSIFMVKGAFDPCKNAENWPEMSAEIISFMYCIINVHRASLRTSWCHNNVTFILVSISIWDCVPVFLPL